MEECFAVRPTQRCSFCHNPFELDERELVLVESGQLRPMRKDPAFLFFIPDHDDENEDELREHAVVEIYHADCLIDKMRGTEWGSNSPAACDLCGVHFRKTRWAFRIKLGRPDFETGIFVPLDDARNATLLCPECIMEGFGEGDSEEGELLLMGARR